MYSICVGLFWCIHKDFSLHIDINNDYKLLIDEWIITWMCFMVITHDWFPWLLINILTVLFWKALEMSYSETFLLPSIVLKPIHTCTLDNLIEIYLKKTIFSKQKMFAVVMITRLSLWWQLIFLQAVLRVWKYLDVLFKEQCSISWAKTNDLDNWYI